MGTTSLILYRRTDIDLDPAPSSQEIVAQVYALSMESEEAITVMTGSGPQQWDVTLTLDPLPRVYGSYELTRTGDTQGTLSAELYIAPKITFTRGTESLIYIAPVTMLVASSGTWTVLDGSATEGLQASRLPLGLALTASYTSALLDLTTAPADVDALRPGPTSVHATAVVDPSASLGRYCTIGSTANIAAGVVIGPNASVGSMTVVAPDAIIGDGAVIGNSCIIGQDSIIGDDVEIGAGATIGTGAIVRSGTTVGAGCIIEAGVTIGRDCVMEDDAHVKAGSRVGDNVIVGEDSTIEGDLIIAKGAVIADSTTQEHSLRLCRVVGGGWEIREVPADGWSTAAVVHGYNFQKNSNASMTLEDAEEQEEAIKEVTPMSPEDCPEGLAEDIGKATAPEANGGTPEENREDPREYDGSDPNGRKCAWFAEDLRRRLAGLPAPGGEPEEKKYKTTFTMISHKNPNWKPDQPADEKWDEGHCLVDIHFPDGKIKWLEAQYTEQDAIGEEDDEDEETEETPPPEEDDEAKMDGNDNGKIEYADHPAKSPDEPTDGNTLIEVYDSREQAEAANGGPLGGRAN